MAQALTPEVLLGLSDLHSDKIWNPVSGDVGGDKLALGLRSSPPLNSRVFLVPGDPYTSYLAGGEGVVYRGGGSGSHGLSPRAPLSTPSPLLGLPPPGLPN